MITDYERRFKTILEQNEQIANVNSPEMTDDQLAMQNTLDDGSEVSDFDIENVNQLQQDLQNQKATQMVSVLKQWIDRISEFKEFMNGTGPNSISSTLAKSVPDTLFDKIKTSESKKIARVAADLSSFEEILKGHLANSSNPSLKYV